MILRYAAPFLRGLQVRFAITFGAIVTICWSFATYLTTLSWWPGEIWITSPQEWARWVTRVVFKGLLAHNLRARGDVRRLRPGEFAVAMCSHPSFLATFLWIDYIFKNITPNVVLIVKKDLNPIIRRTIGRLGMTIEIDRDNGVQAVRAIEAAIPKLRERGALLLIMPDMTRPTRKKIQKDHRRFSGKIPDVEQWLKHTAVPRAGGLLQILQALEGAGVPLYDLTCAYDVVDEGLKDAPATYGATLHIRCDLLTTHMAPTERQELEQWLIARWRAKNELIETWRTPPKIEKISVHRATDAS